MLVKALAVGQDNLGHERKETVSLKETAHANGRSLSFCDFRS